MPPLLSAPFFLQPEATHLSARGLSKAGTGLTTSHQLQHHSLGSWHGVKEMLLSGEEEPRQALSAEHRLSVSALVGLLTLCANCSADRGLGEGGLLGGDQPGTHSGVRNTAQVMEENPQSSWPQPCCLLAWGSSGGGAGSSGGGAGSGIILLVAIPFPQYFNEQSSLDSRRGRGRETVPMRTSITGHRHPLPAAPMSPVLPVPSPKHCCARTPTRVPYTHLSPGDNPCVHKPPLHRRTTLHGHTIPTWVPTYPRQPPLPVDGASLNPHLG